MTDRVNISEVALLNPDYLGIILYEKSPRFVPVEKAECLVKVIPSSIQKVGVLVNKSIEEAIKIAKAGLFDILQLHGDESPDYCRRLAEHVKIIKAFRITESMPENMEKYVPFCSMFLFDTAGKNLGGTGKKFDHSILAGYRLNTNYILGGGISSDDYCLPRSNYTDRLTAVDLNSRFENSPGIKNIEMLRNFIENLRNEEND